MVQDDDDTFTVIADPNDLDSIRDGLEVLGVEIETAEVTMVPQNMVNIEEKHVRPLMKLLDAIEENDDVQQVYSNFDIDPDLLEDLE